MRSEDDRHPDPSAVPHLADAPPGRIGNLLSVARAERGLSLSEVEIALSGELSGEELRGIEEGRLEVRPESLREIASLYGVDLQRLVPPRDRLVLDLNQGFIRAGDDMALLEDGAGRDQVLGRYLGLVYRMRSSGSEEVLALRDADLDALAAGLEMSSAEVADALRELMDRASHGRSLRRRRTAIAVGVLIAAAAAAALAWGALSDESEPSGSSTEPVTTTLNAPVGTTPAPGGAEEADPAGGTSESSVAPAQPDAILGPPAVVQDREDDGSPGEQRDR